MGWGEELSYDHFELNRVNTLFNYYAPGHEKGGGEGSSTSGNDPLEVGERELWTNKSSTVQLHGLIVTVRYQTRTSLVRSH